MHTWSGHPQGVIYLAYCMVNISLFESLLPLFCFSLELHVLYIRSGLHRIGALGCAGIVRSDDHNLCLCFLA